MTDGKNRVFVYIIESPSPDDFLSDRREGDLIAKALKLAEINAFPNLAVSYEKFKETIGPRLEAKMKDIGGVPILYLSAHGDEKGIQLTEGHLVTWKELRELLIPINKLLGGFLIVSLSSCSSFSGIEMAMTAEGESPFITLVCHTGSPVWSDTAVAFVIFYHRLF